MCECTCIYIYIYMCINIHKYASELCTNSKVVFEIKISLSCPLHVRVCMREKMRVRVCA